MRHQFVTMVLVLAAFLAQAQNDYGKWVIHPIFAGENITNCIDTGDDVYYLASDNLYHYDKSTQENEHLNRANYLNDSGVDNIYFNAQKNYLMVAYHNSNIDVIDVSTGNVSNISDIKNADISTSKAINDITFASGNRAVVATDFGFVILNDSKLEVISSFISDKAMAGAMIMGGYLIVNHDGTLYYAPENKHIQQLKDFKSASVGMAGRLLPIGDNRFFILANNKLAVATLNESGENLSFTATQLVKGSPIAVHKLREGGYVASFNDSPYYYTISDDGTNAEQHDGSGIYSSLESGNNMWVLDADGLKHLNGSEVILQVSPNAISASGLPFWMAYDSDNEKLLLACTCDNAVLTSLKGKTGFDTFDGVMWKNVTPSDVPEPDEGGSWPVISPNETNTYFYSTRKLGIMKVTDGKIVGQYSLGETAKVTRMAALRFDSKGNLWVVQPRDSLNLVLAIKPATQARSSFTKDDCVASDSQHIRNLYYNDGFKRVQFAIGAGDTKVATNGDYNTPIVVWESNNDLSLKRSISFASGALPDQDGKLLEWYDSHCLTADNNGLVWMGTTSGVIAFDPSKAFDADFHVTHIKVPRNDGTNLADYLLDGQTINCIAVDGANRKWIGTDGSGLFLVSADGQQVLKNFNATNSVMGSNQIYQVCCDPTGNSVFVTTPLGVAEYKSDATPGQASFSNIYAYPNPVRPDYGGPINITGLMDNSLVKIADPSGNVVCSLKSTGGMVSWDGCNYNGDLVPTGVYTIIASQADGSSGGGTARVLIVR